MNTLAAGLVTGSIFGFLLQRARILRYERQVGALLLKDMTIVKFMFSAVLVGMVGVYLLVDIDQARLVFLPAALGGNIAGGLLLGMGWGLLGYCPGTSFGALGEGRWDALWGILGMVAGAAVFAETYPFMIRNIIPLGYIGSYTLPGALGVNHWVVIAAFVLAGMVMFRTMEKKGL